MACTAVPDSVCLSVHTLVLALKCIAPHFWFAQCQVIETSPLGDFLKDHMSVLEPCRTPRRGNVRQWAYRSHIGRAKWPETVKHHWCRGKTGLGLNQNSVCGVKYWDVESWSGTRWLRPITNQSSMALQIPAWTIFLIRRAQSMVSNLKCNCDTHLHKICRTAAIMAVSLEVRMPRAVEQPQPEWNPCWDGERMWFSSKVMMVLFRNLSLECPAQNWYDSHWVVTLDVTCRLFVTLVNGV